MKELFEAVQQKLPPCRPPLWARTGHLQTILGHLLPSVALKDPGQEIKIPLNKEGEWIHSTYYAGTSSIVVYLFHGLGGSAQAHYMQRTALIARSMGHHVFINNHRGCGQGVGLATEPYHSGRAEDLSQVIAYGRKFLPHHGHIAIGFSLSANALLLLAAKIRGEIQPDMAIAVNGPINLDRAAIKLGQGLNRIYDKRFVVEIKQHVKLNHPEGLGRLKGINLLRDFDEAYTAPVGGFKDRADYYATCSAKQYLKQINIPTLLLTSKDDPFVGVSDYLDAELSPKVFLHVEKHGGHMGYLSSDKSGIRWLDLALKGYLQMMSGSLAQELRDSSSLHHK